MRPGDGDPQARAGPGKEGERFFCARRQRSSLGNRAEVSDDPTLSRRLSSPADVSQRLLTRIRGFHAASDGVMDMPRLHEDLSYGRETASGNRVVRLMARDGLFGVPRKRWWQRKCTGVRPDHVKNHLERDFLALEPNAKWVTDITYVHTAEGWLYRTCTVVR